MFVTMQCLVFDLEHRRVSCAGAGHHQLAILSPGRPPRLACPSSGRPAGLMASNPIERETLPLEPGDTFVLFSDGVSEAMNAAEDFYGEERLLTALSASAGDVGRRHGRDGCWQTFAHSSPARSNRMTSPSWPRAMRPRKAEARGALG